MFDQNIGEHCSNPNCRIRDYLPLVCGKDCKKPFCKDCFKGHSCSDYVEIRPAVKSKPIPIPPPKKVQMCPYEGCTTSVSGPMGISCSFCGNKICVIHRHAHYEKCTYNGNTINSTNANSNNTDTTKKAVRDSWIKRSWSWKK